MPIFSHFHGAKKTPDEQTCNKGCPQEMYSKSRTFPKMIGTTDTSVLHFGFLQLFHSLERKIFLEKSPKNLCPNGYAGLLPWQRFLSELRNSMATCVPRFTIRPRVDTVRNSVSRSVTIPTRWWIFPDWLGGAVKGERDSLRVADPPNGAATPGGSGLQFHKFRSGRSSIFSQLSHRLSSLRPLVDDLKRPIKSAYLKHLLNLLLCSLATVSARDHVVRKEVNSGDGTCVCFYSARTKLRGKRSEFADEEESRVPPLSVRTS